MTPAIKESRLSELSGQKRQKIDKAGEIFPGPKNPEFYKRLDKKCLVVRPA
jgi:hypothetical protein